VLAASPRSTRAHPWPRCAAAGGDASADDALDTAFAARAFLLDSF
jgi:hypothetical protein